MKRFELTLTLNRMVYVLKSSRSPLAASIASVEETVLSPISLLYVGKYPKSSRVGMPSIICANVRSASGVDKMLLRVRLKAER